MPSETTVSLVSNPEAAYPVEAPFHPDAAFPEYPFAPGDVSAANPVYRLVRDALKQLGCDAGHAGAPGWNPLGSVIKPGSCVLVKPNLVLDAHPRGGDVACLITHASVVRALLDYLLVALQGEGRIIVGDAPLQGTDFAGACRASGLDRVLDFYARNSPVAVDLRDFRQVRAVMDARHHVASWAELPGDPDGYVTFDLGEESCLAPLGGDSRRFRVSNYAVGDTLQYHNALSHRYIVAASLINADLIVNVPKLKTHCKAGVTVGLKNFVGTVGRKQCLAHHRQGSRIRGGDEYPEPSVLKALSEKLERGIDGNGSAAGRRLLSLAYRVNERLIRLLRVNQLREGAWYGNDTVWRMVVDLVRIARYGQPDGTLADEPRRRILTVVDGVVAGQGEGPLEADPLPLGCVLAGWNPVAVDWAAAALMGFEPGRVPLLAGALDANPRPLFDAGPEAVEVVCGGVRRSPAAMAGSGWVVPFRPPAGWVGYVEAVPGVAGPPVPPLS